MPAIRFAFESLLHLFYPRICMGCGTDSVPPGNPLCLNCEAGLPKTDFVHLPANPVEKTFWGRLQLVAASS